MQNTKRYLIECMYTRLHRIADCTETPNRYPIRHMIVLTNGITGWAGLVNTGKLTITIIVTIRYGFGHCCLFFFKLHKHSNGVVFKMFSVSCPHQDLSNGTIFMPIKSGETILACFCFLLSTLSKYHTRLFLLSLTHFLLIIACFYEIFH